ncbi:MAG: hypothetical protein VKK42_16720 [Lyngbya sp.]|nr:hypothetical protein [Lyngbya sp.]
MKKKTVNGTDTYGTTDPKELYDLGLYPPEYYPDKNKDKKTK